MKINESFRPLCFYTIATILHLVIQMTEELKLFIWTGFYPNYSSGLAFAVAETEEEAKKMVIEATNIEPDRCRGQDYGIPKIEWGTLEVKPLSGIEKFAHGVLGGE